MLLDRIIPKRATVRASQDMPCLQKTGGNETLKQLQLFNNALF
jgi:hypothetical protein